VGEKDCCDYYDYIPRRHPGDSTLTKGSERGGERVLEAYSPLGRRELSMKAKGGGGARPRRARSEFQMGSFGCNGMKRGGATRRGVVKSNEKSGT